MVLDPDLLERAKTAAARVEEAERQAQVARGDYHAAVRRLHLAGAPLRDIAQALSLSHQRVQQMVDGAGGSWWRKVWRTRRVPAAGPCTWCGRPPAEVSKLIAGPHVFICDACVEAAERAGRGAAGEGGFRPASGRTGAQRCAFCGKRGTDQRLMVGAAAGSVCNDCLRVCREILDASAWQPPR